MPELQNPRHEAFANAIVKGMSCTRAAESAGYSAKTAPQSGSRMLKFPQIAARVKELQHQISTALINLSIKEKEDRLKRQQLRWNKMQQVIDERATAPEFQDVAGGRTGLLVRKLKQIGSGESAQVVEEYEVDTGLLSEIRKHEEHAAHELGQWIEASEKTIMVAFMGIGALAGDQAGADTQAIAAPEAQIIEASFTRGK